MNQVRKKFRLMEWHRGEFIPLKVTNPDGTKAEDGKVVSITQESADELNKDFSTLRNHGTKIKYVALDEPKAVKAEEPATVNESDDVSDKKELQKLYQEVIGKRPSYAWSVEELEKRIAEAKK